MHSPVTRGEESSLLPTCVTHQQLLSITCPCAPAWRAFQWRGKVCEIQSLLSNPAFLARSAAHGSWQHSPFLPCSTSSSSLLLDHVPDIGAPLLELG